MQSGWAVSYALRTDKFYDMLGSSTFFILALASLGYGRYFYARQVCDALSLAACAGGGYLQVFAPRLNDYTSLGSI